MEHDSEAAEPVKTMPEESEVARPEATGDPRVDAAIAGLGELDELRVSEHPPVFERIHGELVEVLGELHVGTAQAAAADRADQADPVAHDEEDQAGYRAPHRTRDDARVPADGDEGTAGR
jgi:hypothetical protein